MWNNKEHLKTSFCSNTYESFKMAWCKNFIFYDNMDDGFSMQNASIRARRVISNTLLAYEDKKDRHVRVLRRGRDFLIRRVE